MNLLETVLPFKRFSLWNFMGLLVTAALCRAFADPENSKAIVAGYLFCWANLSALAYLGGLLVGSLASQGTVQISKHLRGFAMFLGVAKFFLFMIVLFVLVAVLKMPPMYLFAGALAALTFMASAMSYFYLRYVKDQAQQREMQQELVRLERLQALRSKNEGRFGNVAHDSI